MLTVLYCMAGSHFHVYPGGSIVHDKQTTQHHTTESQTSWKDTTDNWQNKHKLIQFETTGAGTSNTTKTWSIARSGNSPIIGSTIWRQVSLFDRLGDLFTNEKFAMLQWCDFRGPRSNRIFDTLFLDWCMMDLRLVALNRAFAPWGTHQLWTLSLFFLCLSAFATNRFCLLPYYSV